MVDKFEEMLDRSLAEAHTVGSIVSGKVVQINEEGIFIDIGSKSEGILQYNKIIPDEIPEINIGDTIEAKIVLKKEGVYYLSKKALDFERGWNKIKKDFESQEILKVKITRKVQNGYMAEAYRVASGFLHEKNFQTPPSIGDEVDVVISEYNPKTKKLLFSRKPLIIAERKQRMEEEFQKIHVGMELEGKVEKLTEFGAFVRLNDYLTGLMHVSEMSHEHIKSPSHVCKLGDKIKVKIISIDRDSGRIGLSHKMTTTDPILDIIEGEDYEGKVENLTDFGAFVRLPNGVVGLVHISEISYNRFNKPGDVLKAGSKVRVKVLNVNIRDRRVSLSIKALEQDPWQVIHEKYGLGERVDVVIKELTSAGIVVKLDDHFEGFVPISEIAYERVEHPSKLYSVGDTVKAQVINLDPAKRKVKLSIKQTLDRFAPEGEQQDVRLTDAEAKPTGTAMKLGEMLAKSGIVAKEIESADKAREDDKTEAAAQEASSEIELNRQSAMEVDSAVQGEVEETTAPDEIQEPAASQNAENHDRSGNDS
ncbi:MAG: S1 RNA-binding domain-containing protein [bacterium]|jgi:small subunit ribosomal protein S1